MLTPKETGGGVRPRVFPKDIEYSMLLDGGPYLTLNPADGNRKKFTLSFWMKKNRYDLRQGFFANSHNQYFQFAGTNSLELIYSTRPWSSNAEYVDTTGWYHIVIAYDTTLDTATDRRKVYVNGTRVTEYSETTLVQDFETSFNYSVYPMYIGKTPIGSYPAYMYIAELHWIDGYALDASTFGELSGIVPDLWVPIEPDISDYGTNGFHLDFANAANLGNDVSGNSNHLTVSGTPEQTTDTPTHNGGVTAWNLLDDPAVFDTSKYADVVLREGTGAEAVIDSLNFTPDFVNSRDRDNSRSWAVFDSERGAEDYLQTDTTAAEATDAQSFKSFDLSGYTLGTSSVANHSGASFVDCVLKAAAGFDIVSDISHTNGSATTFSHGLGSAATVAIIKRTDSTSAWFVYHESFGDGRYLRLDEAEAAITHPGLWSTNTSTQFDIPYALATGTYVAYLWTDSDVFKAFSYTGNGSADGPVIDLGGRPLSIPFLKNSDATVDWVNSDTVRNPYNEIENYLLPSSSSAESFMKHQVVVSNGFKVTTSTSAWNGSGNLIVGLAILRQPFKYSNAF